MRLAVASIFLLASPLIAVAHSNAKCSAMSQFRSPDMTLEITDLNRGSALPSLICL